MATREEMLTERDRLLAENAALRARAASRRRAQLLGLERARAVRSERAGARRRAVARTLRWDSLERACQRWGGRCCCCDATIYPGELGWYDPRVTGALACAECVEIATSSTVPEDVQAEFRAAVGAA